MHEAVDARNLILLIAERLVDRSEAIVVEAIQAEDGTLIRLTVAPEDVGKLIGKQGRTARSIRTILSAVSMKSQHRFALDIVESEMHAALKTETQSALMA